MDRFYIRRYIDDSGHRRRSIKVSRREDDKISSKNNSSTFDSNHDIFHIIEITKRRNGRMNRIFVRRIFEIIVNVCAHIRMVGKIQRTSGWMPGEAKGRGEE